MFERASKREEKGESERRKKEPNNLINVKWMFVCNNRHFALFYQVMLFFSFSLTYILSLHTIICYPLNLSSYIHLSTHTLIHTKKRPCFILLNSFFRYIIFFGRPVRSSYHMSTFLSLFLL